MNYLVYKSRKNHFHEINFHYELMELETEETQESFKQKVIGGNPIKILLPKKYADRGYVAYCDEQGLQKNLPTAFLKINEFSTINEDCFISGMVKGNVVFSKQDKSGKDTELTQDDVELIKTMIVTDESGIQKYKGELISKNNFLEMFNQEGWISLLGILNDDGTIDSITLDSGYPDWVGKLLNDYYSEKEKVLALFSRGNLLILGEEIEPNLIGCGDKSVCVYFHRDMLSDKEFVEIEKYSSLETFNSELEYCCYSHDGIFLYTQDGWLYKALYGIEDFKELIADDNGYIPVEKLINKF